MVEHSAFLWVNTKQKPRVTQHFCYITLGHKDIRNAEEARGLIRTIDDLGGKITRLDFHIDYLGTLDFDAFYDLHDNEEKPTPSIVKTPGGKTVYVGRRSSARMLRVYDKRAEIIAKKKCDIGFNLTRIEIEIKRNMVQRYKALFLAGKNDVILSDIQRLYGLRGFCDAHEASRPTDVGDKIDSVFDFIVRYRRVIRRAYKEDECVFKEIIGV